MRSILRTRRLALRPVAVVLSFLVLVAVAVLALIASLSGSGLRQNLLLSSASPGTQGHIWGTDALGRDVFLLTLAGGRTALVGPVMISCGTRAAMHNGGKTCSPSVFMTARRRS